MPKILILLITIIVIHSSTHAQQLTDSIQDTSPSEYIPANSFWCIAPDNLGNLYLGGDLGLFKWDKDKWYSYRAGYGYRDYAVLGIIIDYQNNVWTHSTSQLFKFSNNKFTRINTLNEGSYGLACIDSNFIYSTDFEKNHKININTLEKKTLPLLDDDFMWRLKVDINKSIWGIGAYTNLVYEIRNDSTIIHKHLNGISYTDILDYTFIDSNYYALYTNSGIKLYNNGTYTTIPTPITNDFSFYSFDYSMDSSLTLCTMIYGIYKYKNNNWVRFDNPEEKFYGPQKIHEFNKDSLGIIYEDNGLSIIANNKTINYKGPDINNTRCLSYFNNTLFIGSYNGHVNTWDGTSIQTMGENPPFYGNTSFNLKQNNTLYSTGHNGIHCYKNYIWESLNEKYHLPDTFYYTTSIDSNLTLYAGSTNGLIIADTLGIQKILNSGNVIWASLLDSKNRLWFSSHYKNPTLGALCLYEDGNLSNESIPNTDGTPVKIFEDSKGNIWVGWIFNSLEKYDLNKFDGETWENIAYNSEYGWHDRGIVDICEDNWGNIYIASNNIYRFDGKTWTHYNQNVGLPLAAFMSVITDNIGNVYVGTTSNGTYVLHFEDTSQTGKPEARKLESMQIYPNPAKEQLNYSLAINERCTLCIYNTLGEKIMEEQSASAQGTINISQLKPGQYVLQIIGEKSFATSNFIVE